MRVAFVLGQSGRGGTETQAKALIAALVARGVSVDVILLDDTHGLDGLPSGTRVLGLSRRYSARTLLSLALAAVRLRQMLKSGHYDVVHSAMARAYVLSMVACLGLRDCRRVTWRRNVGVHLGASRVKRSVERFTLRHTDVLVANSADVRDYWLGLVGVRAPQAVVIPNIVESWRFDPVAPDRTRTKPLRIVTVGGLKPGKAHGDLIEAVGSLPQLRDHVEVVVIGDGTEGERLIHLARSLGVTLTLTGELTDTRSVLADADIYAHPSHSEGSSNAVAEAMAAGLPVVATDVGGMRELLGEDAGVLVPVNDVQALARALLDLVNDPAERSALAQRARARARARLSADQVVTMHLDAYGATTCAA